MQSTASVIETGAIRLWPQAEIGVKHADCPDDSVQQNEYILRHGLQDSPLYIDLLMWFGSTVDKAHKPADERNAASPIPTPGEEGARAFVLQLICEPRPVMTHTEASKRRSILFLQAVPAVEHR